MIPTFEQVMEITGSVSNHHVLQLVECQAMYDTLLELPDGATIVEVGCDYGRSSSLISQMAHAKEMLSIHIDPWSPEYSPEQPARAKQWMEVMCERCPQHPFIVLHMTTVQAAPHMLHLTPGGIDFAFIDGCHDQPVVEKDLQIVAQHVRKGGYLAVHDYPSGGVTEAVDPFVAKGWSKHAQAFGLGVWRCL